VFIDSHAHIFFKDFQDDLDGVLDRARNRGVDAIICPGTDLETSREAVALADCHPMVYAAVGYHPHDASKAAQSDFDEIEKLCSHPKVVAIGEIGLDYHYDYSPRDVQQHVFQSQIEIAIEHNLPIVVHCREADEDCFRIVKDLSVAHADWRGDSHGSARGVFHCFAGDIPMASALIDLNFCISFPGPLTFPSRPGKPNLMIDVATAVPLEHILIETDCPYLTPVPHRGKRNEPAYVTLVADALARIKQLSREEVGRITNEAVKRVCGVVPS